MNLIPHGNFPTLGGVLQVLPAWFLAPFIIGITGGTAAYAAVKNENPRTANNLLFLGFLWSFVLGFLLWFLTLH